MRRKMKTNVMICAVLSAMMCLTACGTETGNGNESATESSLPINVQESTMSNSSGGESKQPDKSQTSGDTQSSSTETTSEGESQTGESSSSSSSESSQPILPDTPSKEEVPERLRLLVPSTGAALSDDTPLNMVFINGTEFDILNCTVQDIAKNGGIVHNSGNFFMRDIDAMDHYFFGEGFTIGFKADNVVHIEALQNGELVTKNAWKSQLDNEAEVYSDYEVKGVSYGLDADDSGFVQFCGGINVGMTKDEIDNVLGRGYEVAITDDDLLTSASYYRTATTTMVIEYTSGRDWDSEAGNYKEAEKVYTISIIKND